MKAYEWILFDADETLFRFDDLRGLQLMFAKLNVSFTLQDYQEYQAINQSLWISYQNGDINAQMLQAKRFSKWTDKLQMSTQALSLAFRDAMAEICMPLDGAVNLLNMLRGKVKLGIITNGFIDLQQIRLERTGLAGYFDLLVIAEQVGIAKPARGIFDHALTLMGNPNRERVLMVGDTMESDILGGLNAGLHTCWFNRDNKLIPDGITPHYQISSLAEIENVLLRTNVQNEN